jgi:hypothetical protein
MAEIYLTILCEQYKKVRVWYFIEFLQKKMNIGERTAIDYTLITIKKPNFDSNGLSVCMKAIS